MEDLKGNILELDWKDAPESKGLKVNNRRQKVMVSG